MGNDKNEQGRAKLRRPREVSSSAGVADWESADAALLVKVIAIIGHKHGAIRLGYTRDGGAYSIGIYAGDDYFTNYVRPSEQIDDYLGDLLASFEEYEPGEAVPNSQKRPKRT